MLQRSHACRHTHQLIETYKEQHFAHACVKLLPWSPSYGTLQAGTDRQELCATTVGPEVYWSSNGAYCGMEIHKSRNTDGR
jgi:hypothetical protein